MGVARAAGRIVDPAPARPAAPHPAGPAPPREGKPPLPPTSWPSAARPPLPSPSAAPKPPKPRESRGARGGAGRGSAWRGSPPPRGASAVVETSVAFPCCRDNAQGPWFPSPARGLTGCAPQGPQSGIHRIFEAIAGFGPAVKFGAVAEHSHCKELSLFNRFQDLLEGPSQAVSAFAPGY